MGNYGDWYFFLFRRESFSKLGSFGLGSYGCKEGKEWRVSVEGKENFDWLDSFVLSGIC